MKAKTAKSGDGIKALLKLEMLPISGLKLGQMSQFEIFLTYNLCKISPLNN